MEPQNRKKMAILSFTLLMVMLGYGVVISILPFYIDKMGASGRDLGFLIAIFSVMQFIFAPIWAGVFFDLNLDYPYFSGAVILFIGFLIAIV